MQAKITISLAQQELKLVSQTGQQYSFAISSALNGPGQRENSGCTPLGEHYVRARIGEGMPEGAVFVGRRFTDEIYSEALAQAAPARDWILTRILWLCGLEKGFNRGRGVDSQRRYIYIHGTPDSEPMGIARSHGCIRMRNCDISSLFDLCPLGTLVDIQ